MKKRFFAVLTVCLLLAGCGGGGQPEATPPATEEPTTAVTPPATNIPDKNLQDTAEPEQLQQLRRQAGDSGALIAAAYLNYAQLPSFEDVSVYLEANGFGGEFPFLLDVTEDRLVRQEGGEVYAIVPVREDVELTVCSFGFADEESYIPVPGEELLKVAGGKPILLIGNISEIVPNLYVKAEGADGTVVEYNPCVSMMDGTLVTDVGVYDFTPYGLLAENWPGYDPVPEEVFCGTWYARHRNANGEVMAMTLTLEGDGSVEYFYGYPQSEIVERFSGIWSSVSESEIALELVGGAVDGDTSGTLNCTLSWDMPSGALLLSPVAGVPLLPGTEGALYVCMPFDGFDLMGSWVAETEGRDWTYELQLFDTTECWMSLFENGVELVGYNGWWYAEDGTLSLNLFHAVGEHPENPQLDYLSGYYPVQFHDPDHISLHFESGSILTLDMEGDAVEEFARGW